MRILLVEDEHSLADLVADRLKKERYVVDVSYDCHMTGKMGSIMPLPGYMT